MMVSGISRFVRSTSHRSWIPHVVHEVLGKLTAAGFEFPDPSQAFQACLLNLSGSALRAKNNPRCPDNEDK
jgi:hypothetical protein